MKIHENQPISGKSVQKTKRSRSDGVFGKLLDNEIQQTSQVQPTEQPGSQPQMQQAWHTLEESIGLLDQAMLCIEEGETPPQQLINDIESLRAALRQQLATGLSATELSQADTLLAVEAERIRSLQS